MSRERGMEKGYKVLVTYTDGHMWVHKLDYRKEALDTAKAALNDSTVASVTISNMNAHQDSLIKYRPLFQLEKGVAP